MMGGHVAFGAPRSGPGIATFGGVLGRGAVAALAFALVCLAPTVRAEAGSTDLDSETQFQDLAQFVVPSQPIRLGVAEVQVIVVYAPSRQSPNVDYLFPTPLRVAAARWGKTRLVAAGQSNKAMLMIRDASVVEVKLPQNGGLAGLFTRQPAARYDGRLAVELVIRNDYDKFEGRVTVRVTRSQTVLEDISDKERRAVWAKMTKAMIADLEREMRKQIQIHLTRYVR